MLVCGEFPYVNMLVCSKIPILMSVRFHYVSVW